MSNQCAQKHPNQWGSKAAKCTHKGIVGSSSHKQSPVTMFANILRRVDGSRISTHSVADEALKKYELTGKPQHTNLFDEAIVN